jgi:hypothetical protein
LNRTTFTAEMGSDGEDESLPTKHRKLKATLDKGLEDAGLKDKVLKESKTKTY